MKWISVEEDLPPANTRCLVYGTHSFTRSMFRDDDNEDESGKRYLIIEAMFSPQVGWESPVGFIKVVSWCPMLMSSETGLIPLTSEGFPAACESLDDSQH